MAVLSRRENFPVRARAQARGEFASRALACGRGSGVRNCRARAGAPVLPGNGCRKRKQKHERACGSLSKIELVECGFDLMKQPAKL